ncbi:expressed unknown protein [Seminavis robusta]|uniref:Uncharacterized protein n=1 Tax=Seminavis robusta TaxID=568900 RepID=A0A9N8EUT8_9STRA|nr:expressed unknown protein [Seminavis robusta]|eukprot:Sro2268_g321320.1 n/a (266) ;mRNA; f:9092-10542
MVVFRHVVLFAGLLCGAQAFVVEKPTRAPFTPRNAAEDPQLSERDAIESSQRRDAFKSFALALSGGILVSTLPSEPAFASGGATAGKYTTIPIAKRRYYGRVQQGVHDFLAMGSEMVKADTTGENVQFFFDVNGVVIVAKKRQDISGQCTKKDGKCQGKEIRDSRWNDMKTSMYLLGNAFRTDQQKPPDKLPTVKAAKAFFKKIDALEERAKSKPKDSDAKAQELYASSLEILDEYLDLVELPPTQSGWYDQNFDTLVGEAARIT